MVDSGPPGYLIHDDADVVAVAVRDLQPGPVVGGYLRKPDPVTIELRHPVPLGHKLALTDIAAGADVIEYGQRVATATADIGQGDYVHVHNVRSARWHNSVA
ncbi:UxaA family hydrolase [Amycolatopsis acidicola]|uniref:UxaA family hydrolase n=2 Tax=Amycolatopsis acidicola TaxID=2596893 RepID=A0A5N0UK25_9PSEU|nr:UxaA family hydrolase [Amycolatopsis acidicola]